MWIRPRRRGRKYIYLPPSSRYIFTHKTLIVCCVSTIICLQNKKGEKKRKKRKKKRKKERGNQKWERNDREEKGEENATSEFQSRIVETRFRWNTFYTRARSLSLFFSVSRHGRARIIRSVATRNSGDTKVAGLLHLLLFRRIITTSRAKPSVRAPVDGTRWCVKGARR